MVRRFGFLLVALVLSAAPAHADETCTLIVEAGSGATIARDGICDRPAPPQSSFKLPLALMGLDAGVLQDAHTPRWEYRPEFNAERGIDQKAHDPASWLANSVVWYSQELTRRLGPEKFAGYVGRFGYGNGDVSGDPGKNNGLERSWLASSLQITPDEQVAFIRAWLNRTLPVSEPAAAVVEQLTPRFAAGPWTVHGKTCSGWLKNGRGELNKSRPVGWFVGWAETGGRKVVFARLFLGSAPAESYGGMIARDALLADLAGRVP